MRKNTGDPEYADESAAKTAPAEASSLEFDGTDPLISRGWRRLSRTARALLLTMPVLLALIVVVTQTGQLFSVNSPTQVGVSVACGVPWMTLRLDDDKQAIACHQQDPSQPPMARLVVTAGSHVLNAAAEGFAPQAIPFKAAQGTTPLLEANLPLSVDGALNILDAVNTYLTHTGYVQRLTLPAALWNDLNLSGRPRSDSLTVEERFEAIAVDPVLPTFEQTSYLRPVAPQPGALGVAIVVVEHIVISDGCSTQLLVRRETAIFSRVRGSVVFSVAPNKKAWTASHPYTLNPAADSYAEEPLLTSLPATPTSLLALAARTQLAILLGYTGAVAGTVATAPVTGQADWGGGVLLTNERASASASREADWLYLGGLLFGLTADAAKLTPLAIPASPDLRHWIATAQAPRAAAVC
ncbi:MAG TPA: hypothetical protein VGP82_10315 [Ktedonobacterales bacterium]|jgi:hypothetical protein|nr:hypothetical protein [Ktedonobacterales bacterium]